MFSERMSKTIVHYGHVSNGACVSSQLSWSNSDVIAGLNKIFKVGDNEEIERLEITEHSIAAYFKRKEE